MQTSGAYGPASEVGLGCFQSGLGLVGVGGMKKGGMIIVLH